MKKKLFFKLFIFAVIGALVTVTSCKDYDDDISRLDTDLAAAESSLQAAVTELNSLKTQIAAAATDTEVAAAVAAAKTAAIDAAKADATAQIAALKNGYTGTLKDLNDAIVAQAALITVLQGNVTALGTDLDAAEVQIAANKAAIEMQQAILDKYFDIASADNIPTALAAIKADLAAANVDIDALSARIDAIDAALNVLNFAKINSMITEISLDYEGDDVWTRDRSLNFSTAAAKLSWTFGQGFPGAIQFVKDQRLLDTESIIEVKVTPVNADLSKMLDKIYLIRRDGNNEVNGFLKAVKAERSTALRAAPSVTGLWNITFQMPASADISNLGKLVKDNTGTEYLFAVAIENTVDVAENAEARYAVSDFGIEIYAGTVSPIYNDDDSPNVAFTVNNTSYALQGIRAISAFQFVGIA